MLGLLLFMLFVGMVAAAAVGIVEEASQASPRDPPPSAAARFGASHPDEAVHVSGALGVLLIGGSGLVGLILRPERPGYSYQVLAAMLGALLTLPVVGNPDNYGGQAGWIDPVLLVFILPPMLAAAVAFPWRRWGSRHGWRPSLLLLAVIAAVPAAWYGVEQALIQRNTFPPTADPHHNAHWWVMGMLAFMIVLVVGAAAVPTTGWRLGAAVGGFAAMVVGVASVVAPSAASAVRPGFAVAATLWGVAVIGFTFRGAVQSGAGMAKARLPRSADTET
jgi:hypothetical protein